MRYKIIDQRQQRIDKEVEKERRKFVYGTYIITLIDVLIMLGIAFYSVKNNRLISFENVMKYIIIYFILYRGSWLFTKKNYNYKVFSTITNIYYILGTLINNILFGMLMGIAFQAIIEIGNGEQIIPAILTVILVYMYSIFSNMSEFLKKNKKIVVWGMLGIYICQLFIVKGKLLTLIVDIVAVIFSLLELKIDVKEVPNEFEYLTNNGKRREINLLPFMVQQAEILHLDILFTILEILKLGLDSDDD
ncbi:hypothetical protein [Ligilactobacillus aviarius]|uniref:hypothetical protein n=2 Tax=Ligilactobacillus aviarius TaxID=1606 RepID=UPI0024BB8931|nr:hypothetical protein [Ligilactobacillus aviarius]